MKIEVLKYDDRWPQYFLEIRDFLAGHIRSAYLSIEHVGSTSVKGLYAKPILDIDIIIQDGEETNKILDELSAIGYIHVGDLGIIGREAFRKTGETLNYFPHNLYVIHESNIAWHNHKYLRDHLRQNDLSRAAYGNLKKSLAEKYPEDIDAYIDGKTDFILSVLSQSKIEASGLKAIEKQNKI